MTRALLIVTLLAMLGVLPGLAGAAQSDAVSNAVSANGPAGYSITASEPAGQPDATASGSLGRDLISDETAGTLSTGGVVMLGVLGLIWIRRHVAAL
jgi:hypothetical protein